MSIHTLRSDEPCRRPSLFVPAIRTPERFEEARDCLARIVDSIDPDDNPEAIATKLSQIRAIEEAIQASPFRFRGNRVVSKGFTPRIVN